MCTAFFFYFTQVFTSGYVDRSQKMQKELEQIYDSVVSKVREQQSFEELEEMEKDAIHFRLDALRRLAHEQEVTWLSFTWIHHFSQFCFQLHVTSIDSGGFRWSN